MALDEALALNQPPEAIAARKSRPIWLPHAGQPIAKDKIQELDTLVALDVQDNGRGFELDAPTASESGDGFGLKSIRAQAERLGGELFIESAPGEGTTIGMALPVN